MTTNQTIGGVLVSRELLSYWAECLESAGFKDRPAEMRALLDAPAPRQNFKKIEMAHVFNALEDVLGKPVLTSNQCHDLARALNDRLLSPLQLLSLPPEYAAAAQPQGEPVAWRSCAAINGKHYITEDSPDQQQERIDKSDPGAYLLASQPLYLGPPEQPAPVAHTMKSVMQAICSIDGLPIFTSNQCHALAVKMNEGNAYLDEVTRLNAKE